MTTATEKPVLDVTTAAVRPGEAAGVAETGPPTQALFEEARRRRRRRYRWGALAVVLALLLATVVLWNLHAGPTIPVTQSRPGPGQNGTDDDALPPTMLVWARLTLSTMAIQVVSSRTGRVLRTLATDDGLFDSTPQPTISKGGTVFYDDSVAGSSTPGPGAPPPVERIMAVPFSGGPVTFVALGHDPVVSPNGRDLAYLTFPQVVSRVGPLPVLGDGPEGIVVRDLATGTSSTWSYSTSGPDIRRLTWMPDSEHLAFSTENLVGPVAHRVWNLSTRVIDVSGGVRPLQDARALRLPSCPPGPSWAFGTDHTMAWAGFLRDDLGLGICRDADITGTEQATQPFVIDLRTGRAVTRLPALRGLIDVGPGGGFQIDPTGHDLAYVGAGLGAGGLYRWALRDWGRASGPVLVRQQVGSVAWVPPALGRAAGS